MSTHGAFAQIRGRKPATLGFGIKVESAESAKPKLVIFANQYLQPPSPISIDYQEILFSKYNRNSTSLAEWRQYLCNVTWMRPQVRDQLRARVTVTHGRALSDSAPGRLGMVMGRGVSSVLNGTGTSSYCLSAPRFKITRILQKEMHSDSMLAEHKLHSL